MTDRPKLLLKIKNYKSLKDISLELRPLTFLFGPNGSGKSSVLSGIRFFSQNLFSLYDDVLLGGPDENKYYFKPDFNTNLLSFENIAHNKNVSDPIVFEVKVTDCLKSQTDYMKYLFPEKEKSTPRLLAVSTTEDDLIIVRDDEPFFGFDASEVFKETKDYKKNSFNVRYELSITSNKKHLMQQVIMEDVSHKFQFSFQPNTASEKSGYEYYKEISFLDDADKNEFVQGLFDNIQMMPFTYEVKGDTIENFVNCLLRNLYRKQSDDYWVDLTRDKKTDLILELIEIADNIFNLYPSVLSSYFKYTVHLPSLRERPKEIYILQENAFSKDDYYGLPKEFDDENEYKSGLSLNYDDPNIKKIFNYFNLTDPKSNNEFGNIEIFLDSAKKFLRLFVVFYLDTLFNLVKNIRVDKDRFAGALLFEDYLSGEEYNLSQASSGLLQLLPIIYKSYYDRENNSSKSFRLIEQPELHLHPMLQSKLAEFFSEKLFKNHNFLIETHSEHIVRKIQVMIAKGELNKERVGVYYFDKDERTGMTTVEEMKVDEKGLFINDWPKNFFDESMNLTFELLDALKSRQN